MSNNPNGGLGVDISVRINAESANAEMKKLNKEAASAADSVKGIKLPLGQLKVDANEAKKTLTDIAASADKAFSKPLGKLQQMAAAAKGAASKAGNVAGAAAQLLGGGAGEALRTVSDIGQIGEQLSALGKYAPLVGVGLAGLNVVLGQLEQSVQRVRDRVAGYSAVIEQAATIRIAGDRESAEARQKELEIQIQAKRETVARLQKENLDALNSLSGTNVWNTDPIITELKRLAELGENFDGSFAKAIASARAGTSEFEAQILATDDAIKKAKEDIKLLTLAYDENSATLAILPEKVKSASDALKEVEDRFDGLTKKSNDFLTKTALGEQSQINKETERGLRNARLMRDATTEQIDSAIVDLGAQRLASEAQIADAQRALDNAIAARQRAITEAIEKEKARTGLTPEINVEEFSGGVNEARKYLEGLNRQFEDTKTQIDDLVYVIRPEVEAREAEERAIERQKEKLEEVAQLSADLTTLEGQLASARSDRADKLREDRARQDFELEEQRLERAIEAARESERLQEEQKKSDAAYTSEVADLNAEYMADELKALEEFKKSEQRINDDYARDNRRRLEDLTDDLTDLAAKGDVAGFMSRSAAGKKDLARQAEDASVAARRRVEDFLQQRKEAADAARQRIEDARRAYEQERRDRIMQAQALINTERAAGNARLKQSELLERQLADLRKRWKQHEAELDNLAFRERERLLINEINAIRSQIAALQKSNTGAPGPSLRPLNPRVAAMPTANAEGGIYDRPTLTINGERPGWGDMLIPYKKSEGIIPAMQRALRSSGGGAAGGITVDMRGAQFGQIATPSDLEVLETRVYKAVAAAMEAAS